MQIDLKTNAGLTIIFKDSYLMLPVSLRELCLSFGIESGKGYFPYKYTDINYLGEIPSINYWSNTPLNEYQILVNEFTNKTWNKKDESIKYCKLDCKSLYELLNKFNKYF